MRSAVLLGEYGVVLRKGMAPLRRALASIVEDERELLSSFFREMLSEMGERLRFLDERLREYDRRVEAVFSQDERCRRLAQVEGVGALAATALVAAVGNAREFRTGRELSAWLGLVRVNTRPAAARYSWALPSAATVTSECC
jgi:transposase